MDNDPANFEQVPYVEEQPVTARRNGAGKRTFMILIGVVAAVLLVGGGAYWLYARHTNAPKTTDHTSTAKSNTTTQPQVPDTTQAQSTDKQYVSNGKDLNLSFTYPSTWAVTPASNNNSNDQVITLTSPLASLTNAAGQSITGKVVATIRPGDTAINELAGDKATAGQASAQIAYTKPTSVQHQYPYLTYIHLAGGADPSSSFEEVMVTGSMSFAKDQVISAEALSLLDPIISARFYACSDQACNTGSAPALSISNNTWLNTDVCMQTLAIFQSLQIN